MIIFSSLSFPLLFAVMVQCNKVTVSVALGMPGIAFDDVGAEPGIELMVSHLFYHGITSRAPLSVEVGDSKSRWTDGVGPISISQVLEVRIRPSPSCL